MSIKVLADQHTPKHLLTSTMTVIKSIDEIIQCEILIDLTLHLNKLDILKRCEDNDIAALIDTSCMNNEQILSHKSLIGCSAFFFAPTNKIEFTAGRFSNFKKEIEDALNFKFVDYPHPSIGFVFGRIFSMVVNEAYLAFETEVATLSDIDRAMQFGVNYPFGPSAYAQDKEIFIATLLNNLQKSSRGNRYELSQHLKSFIKEID